MTTNPEHAKLVAKYLRLRSKHAPAEIDLRRLEEAELDLRALDAVEFIDIAVKNNFVLPKR